MLKGLEKLFEQHPDGKVTIYPSSRSDKFVDIRLETGNCGSVIQVSKKEPFLDAEIENLSNFHKKYLERNENRYHRTASNQP
jgi:hypothetical protein